MTVNGAFEFIIIDLSLNMFCKAGISRLRGRMEVLSLPQVFAFASYGGQVPVCSACQKQQEKTARLCGAKNAIGLHDFSTTMHLSHCSEKHRRCLYQTWSSNRILSQSVSGIPAKTLCKSRLCTGRCCQHTGIKPRTQDSKHSSTCFTTI